MKKGVKRPSYWTDEKLAELARDYPDMPMDEMTKKYKASECAIRNQAVLLGVKRDSPRAHAGKKGKSKWSDEQKRWVLDNYTRLSGKKLSRLSGIPECTIRTLAYRERRNTQAIMRKQLEKSDINSDNYEHQ